MIKLIETKEEFDALCDKLQECRLITLDTEFERRYSYFAKLSIIQIGVSAEEIYIADILKIKDFSKFKSVLMNPKILKVMHALYQDVEIFYNVFHTVAVNLYDTQVAAEALGLGRSISYFDLVKKICNVVLNKEMQKCNWMTRPLASEQLEYAAFDVQFLFKIHEYFESQLYKSSKEELFKSMMIKHHHINTYAILYDNVWRKVSFHNRSESFISKMQFLAALREELAVQEDVPRGHILQDHDLVLLCEHMPSSPKAFDQLELSGKFAKKHKQKIITTCIGYLETQGLLKNP